MCVLLLSVKMNIQISERNVSIDFWTALTTFAYCARIYRPAFSWKQANNARIQS